MKFIRIEKERGGGRSRKRLANRSTELLSVRYRQRLMRTALPTVGYMDAIKDHAAHGTSLILTKRSFPTLGFLCLPGNLK